MTDDRLFDDFPPVTPEEWRAKIIADLKGADFDKKLVWRTGEGFDVQPYYTKEDLELNSDKVQNSILNVPSRSENHWKIRQDLRVDPDPTACNCRIRNILDRGVEAIGLDLQQVEKIDLQFLENLFHEVNLAKVPVYFGNVTDYLQLYDVLLQFLDASGIDLSKFSGSL